jgi:hypothetical protein
MSSTPVAIVPDADARWHAWQLRGAEEDRRMAKRMRGLMLLVAAGFVVWAVIQFT